MARTVIGWMMGIVGAIAGAFLGYLVYHWALRQGYYALVLPGACLGLGANLASPTRSWPRGIVMGAAALVFGAVVDCKSNQPPFDDLAYYFSHLDRVGGVSILMVLVGGVAGLWWGREKSPFAARMGFRPVKV